jgi:hypothetical protein
MWKWDWGASLSCKYFLVNAIFSDGSNPTARPVTGLLGNIYSCQVPFAMPIGFNIPSNSIPIPNANGANPTVNGVWWCWDFVEDYSPFELLMNIVVMWKCVKECGNCLITDMIFSVWSFFLFFLLVWLQNVFEILVVILCKKNSTCLMSNVDEI